MEIKVPEDFIRTEHARPTAYVREAIIGKVRFFDGWVDADDLERLSKWCLEAAAWCRASTQGPVSLKSDAKTSQPPVPASTEPVQERIVAASTQLPRGTRQRRKTRA